MVWFCAARHRLRNEICRASARVHKVSYCLLFFLLFSTKKGAREQIYATHISKYSIVLVMLQTSIIFSSLSKYLSLVVKTVYVKAGCGVIEFLLTQPTYHNFNLILELHGVDANGSISTGISLFEVEILAID